jgi:hypothetical protein
MKTLKALMGVFFALWLLAMLPFCGKQLIHATTVAEFLLNASTSLVALWIVGMFSFWSFQSAFRKPLRKENTDNTSGD